MMGVSRRGVVMAATAACAAVVATAGVRSAVADHRERLPASTLAVRVGNAWRTFWRSGRAPAQYHSTATPTLAPLISWRNATRGLEWGELELAGTGEAWRTRLVVVRVDSRHMRLALDTAFDHTSAGWKIGRAPGAAAFAVNAGQFISSMPWGWVVLDGHQFLPAASAPLATTITVNNDGSVQFVHGRAPELTGIRWAFQSYPTILVNGAVPEAIRGTNRGIDVSHRDARLAIALDRAGRIIVAMTRFDALGAAFDRAPFGLTTPEMAAIMGELGATDAVLLDGGISAQMVVRDSTGTAHEWPGIRAVPLALVAYPR